MKGRCLSLAMRAFLGAFLLTLCACDKLSPLPRDKPGPTLQEAAWAEMEVRYTVLSEDGRVLPMSGLWKTRDPAILESLRKNLKVRESVPLSSGSGSYVCMMRLRMADGREWQMSFVPGSEEWLHIQDSQRPRASYRLTVSRQYHKHLKALLEDIEGKTVYVGETWPQGMPLPD